MTHLLGRSVGTKTFISRQIWGARSSRWVHPNPRDETHLFSYSAKSLDIAGLQHKNRRYIGSATHQSTPATPVASMCDPTGSKTVPRDHARRKSNSQHLCVISKRTIMVLLPICGAYLCCAPDKTAEASGRKRDSGERKNGRRDHYWHVFKSKKEWKQFSFFGSETSILGSEIWFLGPDA